MIIIFLSGPKANRLDLSFPPSGFLTQRPHLLVLCQTSMRGICFILNSLCPISCVLKGPSGRGAGEHGRGAGEHGRQIQCKTRLPDSPGDRSNAPSIFPASGSLVPAPSLGPTGQIRVTGTLPDPLPLDAHSVSRSLPK